MAINVILFAPLTDGLFIKVGDFINVAPELALPGREN